MQTAPENVVPQGLLSGLPPSFTGKLKAEKTVNLRRGEMLFERGDPGDGCYWLQKGVLKVSVASASGEQRILAILGAGAIVGELAMLDGLPRSADRSLPATSRGSPVSRLVAASLAGRVSEDGSFSPSFSCARYARANSRKVGGL